MAHAQKLQCFVGKIDRLRDRLNDSHRESRYINIKILKIYNLDNKKNKQ